ncbi:caprin-2-like [Protopterus annectens]|uniref:caprin-2-like n=1 Tax=Protopterus annectens TaxID=7888 RepID=UPI001CF9E86A|nr:caprin-2-like [Protopterus annectens]
MPTDLDLCCIFQATLPEELHVLSSPPASVTADDRSLSGSEMDLHLSPPRKASVSMPSEEMSFIPSQSFEKEAIITEPVVRKTSIDTTQVKMSLPVEPHQEPPVSAPLSTVPTEQAFQSTVATTTTTPTTSTPFQAVHTVFKVNATLPQRNEKEVKMESAFSTSFNQSYTTASTQTPPQSLQQPIHKTEPSIVVQESLQTALGTYHPEGTSVSSSNVSYLPQQPSGFHRPNQAYFNNRGSVRGTLRGGRGAVASYRPQNGFKAGFDSYRGGTHVVQNGIYIQPAYPGRDYPGMPCTQRESVSQQNYKRGGSVGGPRINSRGGKSIFICAQVNLGTLNNFGKSCQVS